MLLNDIVQGKLQSGLGHIFSHGHMLCFALQIIELVNFHGAEALKVILLDIGCNNIWIWISITDMKNFLQDSLLYGGYQEVSIY